MEFNRLKIRFFLLFVTVGITGAGSHALASSYFGRVTLGSYISDEKFVTESDGSLHNSFATVSSRAYFRVSDLGKKEMDLIGDLRDTHDFFDKLDAERLELTSRNRLQIRQLNLRSEQLGANTFATIGRFPVQEAGAVYADGGLIGFRFNSRISSALFGGYNPQRNDQTYAQWNPDSQVFGAYFSFHPHFDSWNESLIGSAAVVAQRVSDHTDRLYLFGNYYRQWNGRESFTALGYLDFVPNTKVQTAYLSYGHAFSPRWYSNTTASAIDVITYSRRRGLLEQLSPSPYQELSTNLEQKIDEKLLARYSLTYGVRSIDHFTKTEGTAGLGWNEFITKSFSFQSSVGYSKNFTNRDEFIRSILTHHSRKWEADLQLQYGLRKQSNNEINHPLIAEATYANFLSKTLYATCSLQLVQNESVRIYSGFFKVGYRFGSDDVPPLRDGAAPIGGAL